MSEVVAEIAREADSYVAALDRLVADGRTAEGLRLAVRLAPYWNAHGRFAEGRTRLLALLETAAEIPPTLRAQALERIGTLTFEQGTNEDARSLFEQSLAAARAARDEIAEAAAYGGLARCALMAGELDTARRHARACEQIHRARRDERALDQPLHILAYADYIAGDDERARAGFEETLELNRRSGNRRAVARELTNLGSVETRAGNLERAQRLCDEALRLALEIDNPLLVTYCVINLAGVASARGEYERAARLLGSGEAMMEAAGMTLNPGTAIEYERHVERTRKALGDAEYERAVRAGRELDRDVAIEYGLHG
ncbi:MAG TPA: tetratricopeptide repeat protein [Kribbellaceae bacterium]|nr:tetratricopeptide repeat protein [Kribbellaceae bacterium]